MDPFFLKEGFLAPIFSRKRIYASRSTSPRILGGKNMRNYSEEEEEEEEDW